jgi:hypothetical protein
VDDRATRLLEARRDRTAQHLDVALDDERAQTERRQRRIEQVRRRLAGGSSGAIRREPSRERPRRRRSIDLELGTGPSVSTSADM